MNRNHFKRYSAVFFIPILITGGLSACGYTNTPNQGAKTQSIQSQNMAQEQNQQVDRTLALRVVDISDDVPDVKRATAVAYGHDIIVGVEGTQGADPKKITNRVYQTLKKREPGYSIHVTANPQQYNRIHTLSARINKLHLQNNSVIIRDTQNADPEVTTLIREIGSTRS